MSLISLRKYMNDFNVQVQIYQKCKSETSVHLLNRNLSLICASVAEKDYNPDNVECCQFYVNLHRLLGCLDPKADFTWSCISVLQQACKNVEARDAIVSQFRFMAVLAKLLKRISNQDKIIRLLTLIQDLSYGIKITWQESYLDDLIELLVEYIYGEDETIGNLALSVLTNISYKNLPSIYVLMRRGHASTFAQKIKCYGILASKMRIILDSDIDLPNVNEMHQFIKKCFMETEDCIRNWNVPNLRHIVDFLTDSKNSKGLYMAMSEYSHFEVDIGNLLKCINSRMDTDDTMSGDDSSKNQKICFALIFELIQCVLQYDNKNLSSFHLKIFHLATKWINCDHASIKAISLMTTILSFADRDSTLIKEMEPVLPTLITHSENNFFPTQYSIEVLKLIITLLHKSESQRLVFSHVHENYFDKLFAPLLSTNADTLNFSKLSTEEIAKYLYCMRTLMEFSKEAPSVWTVKLMDLFKLKQIHFIIAKSMLSNQEEICSVAFDLARLRDFPQAGVSQVLVKLSSFSVGNGILNNVESNPSLNDLIVSNRLCFSKSLEERVDALLNHIFDAKNNSELNNIAISELVELFQYQTNMSKNREQDLCSKLDAANLEITNLSHRVGLLSNEMTEYQSMNFKLHLVQERLQTECIDLKKQRDAFKDSLSDLGKKLDSERSKYGAYTKLLDLKKTEAAELKKELDKYKKKDAINTVNLKKLEVKCEENSERAERLKQTIKIYEESSKDKQKILEEKERELNKTTKMVENFKENNFKLENLIKHLEEQVSEKNEAIKTYETELKETEDMRKTILSLMQNKKSVLKREK